VDAQGRRQASLGLPAALIAEIQAYCAMIVCMLILIYTGEKPNRAMYQMVWYYLIGTWGSLLRGRWPTGCAQP